MSANRKTIERVQLSELDDRREAAAPAALWGGNLDVIKDLQGKLQVTLGEARLSVAELLSLREQSVITLGRDAAEPLDLVLEGNVVGRGKLVVVGDHFGLQLTEINNQR